jgi:hypothetical protein
MENNNLNVKIHKQNSPNNLVHLKYRFTFENQKLIMVSLLKG